MSEDHQQRVLVLEDDEDCGEVLRCLFEMLGHACVVAHHGREALSFARESELDIAVIDLALPEVSGYEVARALRASRGSAIYLIALSGFSEAAHRVDAYEAGFDRFCVKPISIGIFEELLADARRVRMGSMPTLA